MYRAVMEAFKRHRIEGGVLDIWEHLTTKKCHRCHEMTKARIVPWTLDDVEREKNRLTGLWSMRAHEAQVRGEDVPVLELPSDQELLQRTKRDRDFRVCEHCSSSSEQTWKLRNRDFNGAINILTIMMAELSGEERPTYLCPERKKRRATFGTRKRRIAQNCCFDH
jgi:hypothetical protein